MKLHYLGTAAAEGIPSLFCTCPVCTHAKAHGGKDIRTRSQVCVDETLLFDFPPDSYAHVLLQGLDLSAIEHLFITHSHADHFYPSDICNRRDSFCYTPKAPVLHAYGNPTVYQRLACDCERIPSLAGRLEPHCIKPFERVEAGGARVTALLAEHMHGSGETPLLYVLEKGGKTLLYGNDTGFFPQETWEAIANFHFDVVSLDSTLGLDNPWHGHMDLNRNSLTRERMLAQGLADERTIFIITHFSHNARMTHGQLEQEAARRGFLAAYDGLRVQA